MFVYHSFQSQVIMKYFIFLLVFLFLATHAGAQVMVTDDPDYDTTYPSALLEVKSTSGGLLLPRMTTSEQWQIREPAPGLVIFNTDSADFYGFDGTVWKALWDYPTDTITVITCPDSIEYSGRWYKTVPIDNQCWMAENLNVGTRINASQDQADNGTIEKYCYNDDENNCDTYGGLYQWDEMMWYTTQDSSQGICPSGWRLPSDAEWKELEGTVDTQYPVGDPEWDGTSFRGYDAGKRLKSTAGWASNSGTDDFDFKALPGGHRSSAFYNLGSDGGWWSSTETNTTDAWRRYINCDRDEVRRNNYLKTYGFSVRCIYDPSYCPDSIEHSGQWYNTVQIGDQCWMAENLNVGTRIDSSQAQTNNATIEKYCYSDEEDSCTVYGGLYQWDEVMQYTTQDSAQGVCPAGWHIPSDEEWKVLEGTVDTQYGVGHAEWDGYFDWRGLDAGKRLKSNTGWATNTGTDAFGFTALPGGYRTTSGSFDYLGEGGRLWSSTEDGSSNAWARGMRSIFDGVYRNNDYNDYGFSVRCLKD